MTSLAASLARAWPVTLLRRTNATRPGPREVGPQRRRDDHRDGRRRTRQERSPAL